MKKQKGLNLLSFMKQLIKLRGKILLDLTYGFSLVVKYYASTLQIFPNILLYTDTAGAKPLYLFE